jgi:hypothetical protein
VNLLDSGQLWIQTGERSGLQTHIAATIGKRNSKSLIITSKLFLKAIGNYLKEGGDICFNTLKSPRGFRLKILSGRGRSMPKSSDLSH